MPSKSRKPKADPMPLDNEPQPGPHYSRRYGRAFGWAGPSKPDQRDARFAPSPTALRALPPAVDLRTLIPKSQPFEPNWDQGPIGSCGPHSACLDLVGMMFQLKFPAGRIPLPSRLFTYYATRQIMGTTAYDSGVYNRDLFKSLAQYGWCDEADWPYVVGKFTQKPPEAAYTKAATRKITGYEKIPQVLNSMLACLAGDPDKGLPGRPFVFGFTVYESFMSDAVRRTGVVPMPKPGESTVGGHDVLFCGYDSTRRVFIAKNSWGEEWGMAGDFEMPFEYAANPDLSGDFWTVKEVGIVPPDGPGPTPPADLVSRTVHDLRYSGWYQNAAGEWVATVTGAARIPK